MGGRQRRVVERGAPPRDSKQFSQWAWGSRNVAVNVSGSHHRGGKWLLGVFSVSSHITHLAAGPHMHTSGNLLQCTCCFICEILGNFFFLFRFGSTRESSLSRLCWSRCKKLGVTHLSYWISVRRRRSSSRFRETGRRAALRPGTELPPALGKSGNPLAWLGPAEVTVLKLAEPLTDAVNIL